MHGTCVPIPRLLGSQDGFELTLYVCVANFPGALCIILSHKLLSF